MNGDPLGPPRSTSSAHALAVEALLLAHPGILRRGASTERPESLGRYAIVDEIASGGFGQVFLAHDPLAERIVAIKLTRQDREHFGTQSELLHEARAAARLSSHRNVVPVWDVGETDDGRIYVVLEFCDGGSLSDWMIGQPSGVAPARVAAEIVSQVADGVQHAHAAGILHRDLKPANVLLQLSGPGPTGLDFVPRVADFGLARAAGVEDLIGDRSHGTRGYLAPEQTGGRGHELGPWTDVYGIGAILWTLLTGLPPQAPLGSALRRIPPEVQTILKWCLAPNPRDRYARAGDVADDLRRFLKGEPLAQSGWLTRARRWPRKHPASCLALLVALAVPLVGIWGLDQAHRWDSALAARELTHVAPVSLSQTLARIDITDPATVAALRNARAESPNLSLGACIALSASDPEAADQAIRLSCDGPDELLMPLARTLADRVPLAAQRLSGIVCDRAMGAHERARAATLLAAMGKSDEALGSLCWNEANRSDPLLRSVLIHTLGRSGLTLAQLLNLGRRSGDPAMRAGLLLALGEVSDRAWTAADSPSVASWVVDLYCSDPDPEVHGAAKWLIRRRGLAALGPIDAQLAQLAPFGGERRWRVGPMGLTFVAISMADDGLTFEIADEELTEERLSRLGVERGEQTGRGEDPSDLAAFGLTYLQAVQALNQLSKLDGLLESEWAYRPGEGDEPEMVLSDRARGGIGYRLPTEAEFEVACRAGTRSPWPHGATIELLDRYAWCGPPDSLESKPVGRLKPNGLGLFDMLGNVMELCECPGDPSLPVVGRGGSILQSPPKMTVDRRWGPLSPGFSTGSNEMGIRVARTVRRDGQR
jgi:hypothetical protein